MPNDIRKKFTNNLGILISTVKMYTITMFHIRNSEQIVMHMNQLNGTYNTLSIEIQNMPKYTDQQFFQ